MKESRMLKIVSPESRSQQPHLECPVCIRMKENFLGHMKRSVAMIVAGAICLCSLGYE